MSEITAWILIGVGVCAALIVYRAGYTRGRVHGWKERMGLEERREKRKKEYYDQSNPRTTPETR